MKVRLLCAILTLCLLLPLTACGAETSPAVMTSTKPIYDLTCALTEGTEIPVRCILSEPVSCLHDYTLSVTQMRALEASPLILKNGLGLDDFLNDAIPQGVLCADLSDGIALSYGDLGITMIPQDAQGKGAAGLLSDDRETVTYRIDGQTAYQYALSYTGLREVIEVASYTGQTEYAFCDLHLTVR